MKIKTLISVALLSFSMAAAGQGQTLPNAHEISLNDIRVPAKANGGLNFRTCSTCAWIRGRVTPQTRFMVRGQVVRFPDFLKTVASADDPELAAITVMHHPTSNQIQWLDVWL